MTKITVETKINNKPIEEVWKAWTNPEDITKWNFASDDWECPKAENDLRVGGKLKSRMSAKDNSFGFDFELEYTNIIENKLIESKMEDERVVKVEFKETDNCVNVIETFDAESENSLEMQKQGWQAILENFKKYVESK